MQTLLLVNINGFLLTCVWSQCKVLHWLCFQTHVYFCFPCHVVQNRSVGVFPHHHLSSPGSIHFTQLMNKAGNSVIVEAERHGRVCHGKYCHSILCGVRQRHSWCSSKPQSSVQLLSCWYMLSPVDYPKRALIALLIMHSLLSLFH